MNIEYGIRSTRFGLVEVWWARIRLLWVCGFLDGVGLLCGSTLFGLGSMVAAIIVGTS